MEKQMLVAILYDENNKCERVAKIYNKTEKEYNALLNEQTQRIDKERIAKENQSKKLSDLSEKVKKLEKRDFMLAKSIYDNFVDRGLINDNDIFQADFYNFVFNDKELKIEQTPIDFQFILRKVGNL